MTSVAFRSECAYTFAPQVAVKKTTKSKIVKAGAEQLVDAVVHGMEEVKGHDIVVMDLRQIPNALSDFFVVCHGTSNTQVQAIADSVENALKNENLLRSISKNAIESWNLFSWEHAKPYWDKIISAAIKNH